MIVRNPFWKKSLLLTNAAFIWSKNINIITIQNNCVLCVCFKCNLLFWSKLNLKHLYSSLQCHMIFRNHVDLLQKKTFLVIMMIQNNCNAYFFVKTIKFYFSGFFDWIESSKEQYLFIYIYNFVYNYTVLLLVLIYLMHLCWLKDQFLSKTNKTLTIYLVFVILVL